MVSAGDVSAFTEKVRSSRLSRISLLNKPLLDKDSCQQLIKITSLKHIEIHNKAACSFANELKQGGTSDFVLATYEDRYWVTYNIHFYDKNGEFKCKYIFYGVEDAE